VRRLTLVEGGEVLDAYAAQIAFLPGEAASSAGGLGMPGAATAIWLSGEGLEIGVWRGLQRMRTIKNVHLGANDQMSVSTDGRRVIAGQRIYDLADGHPVFPAGAAAPSAGAERGWEFAAAVFAPDETQMIASLEFHPSRCCQGRGPDGELDHSGDRPRWKPEAPIRVVTRASAAEGAAQRLGWLPLPGSISTHEAPKATAANGRFFVIGGPASLVWVFVRPSLSLVASLDSKDRGSFRSFHFTAAGDVMIGVWLGHILVVFDTATWTERARFEVMPDHNYVEGVAIHPTLPVIVTGGWDENLRVSSLVPGEEGKLLWSKRVGRARAMAFSPSGAELLVSVPGYPKNKVLRYTVEQR